MIPKRLRTLGLFGLLAVSLSLQFGCAAPFRAVGAATKMVAETTSAVARTGANLVGTGARATSSAVRGALSNPGAAAPLLMGLESEQAQAEPPIEP